jgi:hypothetical protein
MKHYIEISGRATAKTFRLIQKINSFLAEHPGERVALITPHTRQWSRIKEKISPDLVGALDCLSKETLNNLPPSVDILCTDYSHLFFDEFDSIGLDINFVKNLVKSKIPYTVFSNVVKQREVTQLDPNDPLVYLIKKNNGLYITGTGLATDFVDSVLFRNLDGILNDVIEREYLATLFYTAPKFDKADFDKLWTSVEKIKQERAADEKWEKELERMKDSLDRTIKVCCALTGKTRKEIIARVILGD